MYYLHKQIYFINFIYGPIYIFFGKDCFPQLQNIFFNVHIQRKLL